MKEQPISKNPYADPEGGPKDGSEIEFFAWEEARWLEKLAALPENERLVAIAQAKAMFDKMNS